MLPFPAYALVFARDGRSLPPPAPTAPVLRFDLDSACPSPPSSAPGAVISDVNGHALALPDGLFPGQRAGREIPTGAWPIYPRRAARRPRQAGDTLDFA
jgi:hypothetical protein